MWHLEEQTGGGDAETLTDTNRMASLTALLSEVVLEGLILPVRLLHQRWFLRVVLPVSECEETAKD